MMATAKSQQPEQADVRQEEQRQRNTLHMNTEPQVREPACVPTHPLRDQSKSQAFPCHSLPAYKMEKTPSSWEHEEICWEVFAFLARETWASIVLSTTTTKYFKRAYAGLARDLFDFLKGLKVVHI